MSVRNRIARLENVSQGQVSQTCLCPQPTEWPEDFSALAQDWLECPKCHKPRMPPGSLAEEMADVLNQIYSGEHLPEGSNL